MQSPNKEIAKTTKHPKLIMNRTPMSQSYVNSQAGQQQSVAASPNPSSSTNPNQTAAAQQAAGGQSLTGSVPSQQQATAASASLDQTGGQMAQLMCATELTNLLLEFAFSVFVNKPDDIIDYAASYFDTLNTQRGQQQQTQQPHHHHHHQQQQQQQYSFDQQAATTSASYNKRASNDSQRSTVSSANNNNNAPTTQHQNSGQNSDYQDDDSMDDFDMTEGGAGLGGKRFVNFASGNQQPTSFNRRKSVFAEQYDPSQDQEDDENNRVVHSKTDEQRQRLAKAIKAIFIFRSVDPQDMTDILDAMFEVKVSAGDIVIRQGDDGDNFYVVEQGKFQIYVTLDDGTKMVRGEYENSGSFGELALMYNQPRAATVLALSDGSLWAMDRNTFRKIILKRAFKKRKEYEALFEKVSVLQGLNGYERMNLCDALVSQRFPDGQKIIAQGDCANGMYFIESGNVKIVKKLDDGHVIEVAVLGKGDYFGELALINHKPRAASVYALGDEVKLAFLDTKAFERLLGSCIDRMEKNCAMYLSEIAHNEGRQNV